MRSIKQCRSLLIGILLIDYLGGMSNIGYAAGFDPTVDRVPAWQCSVVLGRIVFTMGRGDPTDPCPGFNNGKLLDLDAFSGKMLNYAVLDTNADGVVDSNDTISSGVVFIGENPTEDAIDNGAIRKVVINSNGGITTQVEKSDGGSRRIMWRQIQ